MDDRCYLYYQSQPPLPLHFCSLPLLPTAFILRALSFICVSPFAFKLPFFHPVSLSLSLSLFLSLSLSIRSCRGICARCVYHHGREGEQSLLFQRNKSPPAARRTGVKTCEMKFTNGHRPVFILTANLNGPLKFSW